MEAFRLWLKDLDIVLEELDGDRKVAYKAQYDLAHPEKKESKTPIILPVLLSQLSSIALHDMYFHFLMDYSGFSSG